MELHSNKSCESLLLLLISIMMFFTFMGCSGSPAGNSYDNSNCSEAEPVDILFIGNSYTSANSLPSLVSQLACSLGYKLDYDSYTPGGYWFLDHKDYVVLQNQSQVPGWKPADVEASSKPHAVTLVNQIKSNNSQTEIIYFVTWGRQNGDTDNCAYYPLVCTFEGHTTALKEGYDIYQSATGGLIAPVGTYWRLVTWDSMANRPFASSNLWSGDGSHPSLTGSFLTAAVILDQIIADPLSPSTYNGGLTPDTAAYLLSVADSLEPVCGNNLEEIGEECDTGGASATCNADCTLVP